MSANVVGMCCAPAGVDLPIAANVPAQLPQPLQEHPSPGLIISIVRACGQEHADPPHLVSRLLRARRERPRRRAAEKRNEIAPSHVLLSGEVLKPITALYEMPHCAAQQRGARGI